MNTIDKEKLRAEFKASVQGQGVLLGADWMRVGTPEAGYYIARHARPLFTQMSRVGMVGAMHHLPRATVYQINDVAKMRAESADDVYDWPSLYALPPNEYQWFDYPRQSRYAIAGRPKGEYYYPTNNFPRWFGAMLIRIDGSVATAGEVSPGIALPNVGKSYIRKHPDGRWYVIANCFHAQAGTHNPKGVVYYGTAFYGVNERGRILADPASVSTPTDSDFTSSDGPLFLRRLLAEQVRIISQACALLNCKNVGTVDVIPPERFSRRHRRETNHAPIKYKILRVYKPGKTYASNSTSTGLGSTAEHVVDGHFAHYGPEFGKGLLFGKIAGQFWIQSYVKGDAANGVIVKDYDLRLSKSNAATAPKIAMESAESEGAA